MMVTDCDYCGKIGLVVDDQAGGKICKCCLAKDTGDGGRD